MPDLPVQESALWRESAARHNLATIFVAAPSTTAARLRELTAAGTGFIYASSLMGVTGVREAVSTAASTLVRRIRATTELPVCVGIGISNAAQAAQVARFADGVIVASTLVKAILDAPDAAAGTATELEAEQVVAMLWAAVNGIKARGQSDVGDKTLLDALVPATESIEQSIAAGLDAPGTLRAAAQVARERAEATRSMLAKRGRASYTGERSIGTLDAGAVAVAVMFEALAGQSQEPTAKS